MKVAWRLRVAAEGKVRGDCGAPQSGNFICTFDSTVMINKILLMMGSKYKQKASTNTIYYLSPTMIKSLTELY